MYDLNLIRPTIATEIRAGVIMANIPWNTINVYVVKSIAKIVKNYNSQIKYKEQFNKMIKLYQLSLGRLIILKINEILNYV
jgi:hypothetical protein